MSRSTVLIPVLAGAAALGVVAYAFSRPSKRLQTAQASPAVAERAARESMLVPRSERAANEDFDLDLDGIFDANPEDALEHATVQADTRVPALASADDAEPPSPEDLGAYWLSRATESERSRSEADLELDLEGLADPAEAADRADVADEEADDDDAALANDPRVG